jgi:hypothetical protein
LQKNEEQLAYLCNLFGKYRTKMLLGIRSCILFLYLFLLVTLLDVQLGKPFSVTVHKSHAPDRYSD